MLRNFKQESGESCSLLSYTGQVGNAQERVKVNW